VAPVRAQRAKKKKGLNEGQQERREHEWVIAMAGGRNVVQNEELRIAGPRMESENAGVSWD